MIGLTAKPDSTPAGEIVICRYRRVESALDVLIGEDTSSQPEM